MIPFEAFIVLVVTALIILGLIKEWFSPSLTFFAGILVLILFNIITPEEALKGFANEQLAIIVLLLLFGDILRKSSAVDAIFRKLLRKKDNKRNFLFKMMSSVGLSSAFFNNTPLVAMMIPYVYTWSREHNFSPSKFLIPLSYASILGGCITLIGTSTNLIANGIAQSAGAEPLALFDFAPVGGAMFILGMAYLMLFSNKLLPDRRKFFSKKIDERRYFTETHIQKGSPLIGKSIQNAGLRNLKGAFLVEIVREGRHIRPVSSNEVLEEGDLLFFAGEMSAIIELSSTDIGLSLPQECALTSRQSNDLIEVVVSHNSALAGQTIKKSNFRGRYDAAVMAIHRNGEKVWGQLGNIELHPGDVLLVMAGPDFKKRIENTGNFYIISNARTKEEDEVGTKKAILLFGGMVTAILLTALGLVSLFKSLLILLLFSVLAKVARLREIRNRLDVNLILIIGLGLALGKAMENSGAAQLIADGMLNLSGNMGITGLLITLFFVTNLLSSIITSKAAVAVILPISVKIALSMAVPTDPFVLVVAFAGAANFITPVGYQTNLMVYGPGGYRFKDFIHIGFPLTLLYLIVCITILMLTYQL